jgi:hypothetical protein
MMSEKTKKWLQSLKVQEVNTIKFLQNWNEKLSRKEFTTIRIFDPKKYKRGDLKRIELKGNFCMYAGIYQVKKIKLCDLTSSEIKDDTGLSRVDAYAWFEKFYGKNFLEKDYSLIFLREISRDENLILKLLGYGENRNIFI